MTKHKTPEELLEAKKEALYTKHIHCPVCSKAFTTKKVKMSAIRPAKRDTDFQATFASDNPDWYEIFVCPACGYSAFEGNYQDVSPKQKLILEKTIKPKWNPRDFGGVRTLSEAIESHMLALICYQVMGAKKSTLGKLCLRIAWLYRGEDDEKEMAFMTSAVRNFEDAYATERLDEDKANEINIMYLMGELNRRIGNYTEAARWFSVLIQDPELKKIRHMNIKVREQMSQTREDNNRAKAAGIKTNTILDDNEEK